MFWIGFAAGTGICFLVCINVISAIGTHAAAARKDSNERLYQYWDSTDANIKQYIVKMGDVATAIRESAKSV